MAGSLRNDRFSVTNYHSSPAMSYSIADIVPCSAVVLMFLLPAFLDLTDEVGKVTVETRLGPGRAECHTLLSMAKCGGPSGLPRVHEEVSHTREPGPCHRGSTDSGNTQPEQGSQLGNATHPGGLGTDWRHPWYHTGG